jgi:hypothetical protein
MWNDMRKHCVPGKLSQRSVGNAQHFVLVKKVFGFAAASWRRSSLQLGKGKSIWKQSGLFSSQELMLLL